MVPLFSSSFSTKLDIYSWTKALKVEVGDPAPYAKGPIRSHKRGVLPIWEPKEKQTYNLFFFFSTVGKTWTADLGRFPQMRERFWSPAFLKGDSSMQLVLSGERVRTTSTVLPLPKKDYTMMTYQGVVTSLIGEKEKQWMIAQLPCFSLAAIQRALGESSLWLEDGGDQEREKFK